MLRIFALLIVFTCSSFWSPLTLQNEQEPSRTISMDLTGRMVELILDHQENQSLTLPSSNVLELGLTGFLKLVSENQMTLDKPLTIIDYSLPSSEKRMWIIDVNSGQILKTSLVSHGRNSGNLHAEMFSNTPSSFMSSLGFYLTAETYQGKHGYSLRLDGLEEGFNDKARERAIVIHGAEYASEEVVKTTGRLGRSLGCPALPETQSKEIIDLIKEQCVLFIFGNDLQYLGESPLIRPALS
ncbi:murein L,D-transpeptidase catalytic domain family protein [Pararhodonellum marinum]|uniref:murein L,D-transpeptidase catalytic domain family protein n=1 Tax=Pararhodonellum marinum TaxID=2755358 RepID=UPI00188F2A4A|nr:murein L,D-transpeptidase catalytic domain family protein [Pararhodonellum marinum]